MKTIRRLWMLAVAILVNSAAAAPANAPSAGAPPQAATGREGVALAIIYDTSGSMRETVRDASGGSSPKYVVGNRALLEIAKSLEAFLGAKQDSSIEVQSALFTFQGGVREVIPFGPFKAKAFRDWAAGFASPSGDTPLGNALNAAAERVLKSKLPRKHILVITDGINTTGPQPADVLPKIKQRAAAKGDAVFTHFVAFDIDAKVFAGVKKEGATVLAAADETQLGTQLEFILRKKILLEDEETNK